MATDTPEKQAEAVAEAGSGADEKPHLASNGATGQAASPAPSHEAATDGSDSSQRGEADRKDGVQTEEPATGQNTPPAKRSKAKIALIMLSLCMAVFLAALDITIITTALPTISEYFHSSAGYTWIGSSFLLAIAATTPIWGKFSDIFGRKPALLIANLIFFVGSLLAGVSVSIGMLIFARAVQGIGGGGLVVLANICIGDLFSQRERGAYYGMIGGVWALASSLGPILGGLFAEKVSWRWCFYINLPIDAVAFCIIFFLFDVKTPKTPLWDGLKAIDWLGSLLIVGATLMFLFGMQYGGETFPWNSATVICLLVFGVLTGCLFAVVEWKFAKYPVIPIRIFKYRSNIAALCVCFCHGFVFISGSYYLPLYFQASLGATPLLSGVYVLAQAVSLSLGSVATGIFIRKTGHYLPPIFFGVTLMTIGYGLFINLDRNSSWTKIILFQIVSGIGVGPNFQAPLIALQTLVAPRDIGSAVATFAFVRNISTAISVVIGQVVFQNVMSSKQASLTNSIGAANAAALGGGNAGASVRLVDKLPPAQKLAAQTAFANSLSKMWILYCCVAFLGLISACFITKQTLQKTHEETRTGLAAEEENRLEAKAGRDVRRMQIQGAGHDGRGGVKETEMGEKVEV